METRALEAYWAGFGTWCLDATDRPSRRHAEVIGRVRALVLSIGDELVAVRHGGSTHMVLRRLDQLAWQLGVAQSRGALRASELGRFGDAIHCVRGLLQPAPPRRRAAARQLDTVP